MSTMKLLSYRWGALSCFMPGQSTWSTVMLLKGVLSALLLFELGRGPRIPSCRPKMLTSKPKRTGEWASQLVNMWEPRFRMVVSAQIGIKLTSSTLQMSPVSSFLALIQLSKYSASRKCLKTHNWRSFPVLRASGNARLDPEMRKVSPGVLSVSPKRFLKLHPTLVGGYKL